MTEVHAALKDHRAGDTSSVARLRSLSRSSNPTVASAARDAVAAWVFQIISRWVRRAQFADGPEGDVGVVVAERFLADRVTWLASIENKAAEAETPLTNSDYERLILGMARWRAIDLARQHWRTTSESLDRVPATVLERRFTTMATGADQTTLGTAEVLADHAGMTPATVTKMMRLVDPTGQHDVFLLLAIGYTEAEVAAELGVTASALRQRLSRARRMLRETMAE